MTASNLARLVTPEYLVDFVDLVVPELQSRGAFKTEYREGPFREKIFGSGRARLGNGHPGAAYRGAYRGASATNRRLVAMGS